MDIKIGICSWSVGNDLILLKEIRERTGVFTVHLHIRPELGKENMDFINTILENGWDISCGMVSFEQEDYSTLESIKETGGIVPDIYWSKNRDKVFKAVDILSGLSVSFLSFHFGFVDTENMDMIERVRLLADYAGSKNIVLLMETGQETAQELLSFIQAVDHSAIGINFDPANMLLYGKGDPIGSLELLIEHIKHVHLKDALPSEVGSQWGQEVPWSEGYVGGDRFIEKLVSMNYIGTLCVEREQGSKRVEDIISAIVKTKGFIRKQVF